MTFALVSRLTRSNLGAFLAKAVLGSAGLRFIGMGLGFLYGVQLARGLGVEAYGAYGTAMSLVATLLVPAEFGLPQLLTREVAAAHAIDDGARVRGLGSWGRRYNLGAAALCAAGLAVWLVVSAGWINEGVRAAALVGILLIPAVSLNRVQGAILRGCQRIVLSQVPETVVRPLVASVAIAVVALTAIPLTPSLAMGSSVLGALFACVVGTIALHKVVARGPISTPTAAERKALRKSALPMALVQGMRILQGNLVTLLLAAASSVAAVGLFKIANSTIQLVLLPASVVTLTVTPTFSALLAKGDKRRLQKLASMVTLSMFAATAFMCAPFMFMGDTLLTKVFGSGYAEAESTLLVLCLTTILTSSAGTAGVILSMARHEKRVLRASLISISLLFFVIWPLAAKLGSVGAAWAITLSSSVWRLLMVRDCRRLLDIDPSLFSILRSSTRRLN